MRFRRLTRALTGTAVALVLAGCASLHPGEAAVVGDTTITDSELEEFTDGFCTVIAAVNEAQGTPVADIPVRTAILSGLNLLVIGAGADQLAAREGVEITRQEIRGWISALPPVFDNVPPQQEAIVEEVTERIARNSVLADKIGAMGAGVDPPGDPTAIAQRGTQRILDYLQEVGAETDPRYGQVLDTSIQPGTGSLSVPVSAEALQAGDVPGQGTRSLTRAQSCG